MLTMKKQKLYPAWKAERLLERLAACRALLSLHGVLTQQESYRCLERIDKRFWQEVKEGKRRKPKE